MILYGMINDVLAHQLVTGVEREDARLKKKDGVVMGSHFVTSYC